jgi:biotin operon repressor/anti-sigma regulatory factor (Ser/Thr protein kinase)
MDMKEKILALVREKNGLSGVQLSEALGISRQAVNKHLKTLLQNGSLIKIGVTRGAVYKIATTGKKPKKTFKKSFFLEGLEEDKVFQQISLALNLTKTISPRANEIARYAFTEMLNNAIDHSQSDKCQVEVIVDEFNFQFRIRDYGMGVFFSIYDKYKLTDENSAVGELIKGKTTTMREKHTGEGIFFTSKVADKMFFRSHRIKLFFDNQKNDIFIEEMKNIRGTEVFFIVKKRSRKKLEDIFSIFAPEEFDYKFEKTRAMVKLFQREYISRSEARRLHHGLDKFKVIILDFKGVKTIGQGFADELFRVFMQNHPKITLEIVHLKPSLQTIINHVVDNKINSRLTIN